MTSQFLTIPVGSKKMHALLFLVTDEFDILTPLLDRHIYEQKDNK